MTTLDFSSAAESSMDDGGSNGYSNHLQTLTKSGHRPTTNTATHRRGGFETNGEGEKESGGNSDCAGAGDDEDEGDPEVWETFNQSFKQVQSVLDRNRVLIQQVDENHQSKIPDNLAKNVGLIQEINRNISKVVSLYSNLSSNFSCVFHQRNGESSAAKEGDSNGEYGGEQLNDKSQ